VAVVRHNVNLDAPELKTVLRALLGGSRDDAAQREGFRRRFEMRSGLGNTMLFSSATAAFYQCISTAGWKPGEIVLPEYEFHSVPQAVKLAGHEPVYCPVDPRTYLLDMERIESRVTDRTRAVLALHTFGLAVDLAPLRKLCNERGLALIEDCAHAAGAHCGSGWVGRQGDISIFSFGDGKNMVCLGGGLAAVRDAEHYRRLLKLSAQAAAESLVSRTKRLGMGLAKWMLTTPAGFSLMLYPALRAGLNKLASSAVQTDVSQIKSPPSSWSNGFPHGGAALGLLQIGRIDELNARRVANAAAITEELRDSRGIELPVVPAGCDHVFLCYAVKVGDAPALAAGLLKRGVDVRMDYMTCFNPDSELADNAKRILYLPNHTGMTPEQASRVGRTVADLL